MSPKCTIRIITVEREYGSGGAAIAQALAQRLGWKLWDRDLTAEIARVAKVDHRAALRCDERVDTLPLPIIQGLRAGQLREIASDWRPHRVRYGRMVETLQKVMEDVASRGNSVIVGRGSAYFLRNRPDTFHIFTYAPVDEKIRRLKSIGKSEKEALQLIEEIDRERGDRSSAITSTPSGPPSRSTI